MRSHSFNTMRYLHKKYTYFAQFFLQQSQVSKDQAERMITQKNCPTPIHQNKTFTQKNNQTNAWQKRLTDVNTLHKVLSNYKYQHYFNKFLQYSKKINITSLSYQLAPR